MGKLISDKFGDLVREFEKDKKLSMLSFTTIDYTFFKVEKGDELKEMINRACSELASEMYETLKEKGTIKAVGFDSDISVMISHEGEGDTDDVDIPNDIWITKMELAS